MPVNSITVYMPGRTLSVLAYDITHLEGEGNYTFVCTRGGKRYLVSKNLKVVQEMLDANFLRIHKSYMINPYHVVDRLSDSIQLSCGKVIPIARRRCRETHETLAEMEC